MNVAILDDGFQDFSIKKNLSIICFNEKQWIGNGLTDPLGTSEKQSFSSLKKAHDCVIINGKKNKILLKIKYLEQNEKYKNFLL